MDQKNLFFCMEVHAPWPEFPDGRLLIEENRHLTLVFLGKQDATAQKKILSLVPPFERTVGFATQFDQCLFLPPKHPRVAAYHIQWRDEMDSLLAFRENLMSNLKASGFEVDMRPFLPHVTVARSPFIQKEWEEHFQPLPCTLEAIHLCESLGSLKYRSLWKMPLFPPFSPLEHTADIAFTIRGYCHEDLYRHAVSALCFTYPPLIAFDAPPSSVDSHEDVIIGLGELVSLADSQIGIPFKAVSFHGDVKQEGSLMTWEMIVDV